jgi:hypothetical protein
MKHVAVLSAVIAIAGLLADSANAKTVWDQITESAPRSDKPFVDIDMMAPRSVFGDFQNTAPRAVSTFGDLATTAP